MRFEYVILMIIAFNIISAVVQRRAKKRAEAEEQAAHTQGGSGASVPEPEEVERLPSFGRDILDQLARDLGLKIPRPQTTTPGAPGPSPSGLPHPSRGRPREASPPSPVLVREERTRTLSSSERSVRPERNDRDRDMRSRGTQTVEVRTERVKERMRPAPSGMRPVRVTTPPISPEISSKISLERAARPVAVSVIEEVQQKKSPYRPDLTGPGRLREAFILKEILDAPVARRPRRY